MRLQTNGKIRNRKNIYIDTKILDIYEHYMKWEVGYTKHIKMAEI